MPGSEEDQKRKKLRNELGILAERPTKFKIGDEEFQIYPISLGKLDLLSEDDEKITDVMNAIMSGKSLSDKEVREKLQAASEGIARMFHILTTPNDGKQPKDISKEEIEALRWKLDLGHLWQIMLLMRTSAVPTDMLKNVASPELENQAGSE